MRARDARAIAFCIILTLAVALGSMFWLHSYAASLALTGGCAALLFTRPRVIRAFRRLGREPGWSGYFDNRGTRFRVRPAPGRTPSSPRPAGRP